jgi:predicted transcriptional regulator of viral defense system
VYLYAVTREIEKRIVKLVRDAGMIRAAEVEAHGIHRKYLAEMVKDGTLQRVGRGLYRLANTSATEHQTLAEVCKRVPNGVICLLSALSFHKMTTQLPHAIWIAVERNAWRPWIERPKLRVVWMTKQVLEAGVERHKEGRAEVRVFSKAKTVVDCFKRRNVVGIDVALEALRAYLDQRGSKPAELVRLAKLCRVSSVMKPYLEALLG